MKTKRDGRFWFKALLLSTAIFWLCTGLSAQTIQDGFPAETVEQRVKKLAAIGQTNISFDSPQIGNKQLPAVNAKGNTIEQALEKSLAGSGLTFKKIAENTYIIISLPVKAAATERKTKISGKVVDNKGLPIIGSTVQVKELANAGTMTDADGTFILETILPSTLTISYIGYQKKEIQIKNNSPLHVVLESDDQLLDEVVVVGYGVQKKVNLTGAVSSIGSDQLEQRTVLSTSAALQGLAPGVTVTTQSGAPGGDGGQIRIRGIGSFGGSDSSPLILIDGIEGNIDMLDVNLIESVSVLKDAASSAIYGSRAANGVILITTKRGTIDNVLVNYKGYAGWQQATRIPEVTDGLTFMKVFNEASMNDNGYELYDEKAIEEYKEKYAADPDNFDWQKAVLSGSGFLQNHFVSLCANSDKIHVMPSFGYSDQQGIIKNTGFKRYIFRNNMDIAATDKLSVKLDVSFNNSDRTQIADEGTIWNYLGRMPTNIPIKRNGLWSEGWVNNNIVGFIEEGGNKKTNNIEFIGNLNLDYSPFKWLKLNGIIAPRYKTRNTHTFKKSLMTYNDDGSEAGASNTYTDLTETASRYYYENYQFYASTSHQWKEHSFNLMLGTSRETYDEKYLMGYRRDYQYDDYEVLDAGADNETKNNGGARYQWALISAFGRFNYSYKDRYLFEANVRRDGSSRFSSSNRWATFPSFSAGWRISEEAFMADYKKIIDQLKLRASWGKLGNQNIGSTYYPFAEMLAVGSISMNDNIYPLVTLNTMSNSNLIWEETTMIDFGVDVNLWNHFSMSFDWYRKNTDGILLRLNTTELSGLSAPYQNAAKVRNTGYDISVSYDNRWGDWSLGVNANLSDVKNEITDMKGQTSGDLLRQQEGSPLNSIYGYVADGLYQSEEEIKAGPTQIGTLQPGDIRYKDLAGAFDENNNPIPDGKITDADKTIIGNTIPRYTYGFNLNIGWKGIKLAALFQGVGKVDGYLNSHYVIPCVNSSAVKTWQLDYWTEENRDAAFPRLSTSSTNNTQNSTFWMKSAAYLRLKSLQLGYSIPKDFIKKLGVKDLYLYVDAQNLFTLTDFWKGYDPEVSYNASAADGVSLGAAAYYPQVQTFSVGLDIKF